MARPGGAASHVPPVRVCEVFLTGFERFLLMGFEGFLLMGFERFLLMGIEILMESSSFSCFP